MHALKQWMISATADEIRELTTLAETSREYLYQLTGGHRQASAEMAGRIADAADQIRRASRKTMRRLPLLRRAALCVACANCPHARACRGQT